MLTSGGQNDSKYFLTNTAFIRVYIKKEGKIMRRIIPLTAIIGALLLLNNCVDKSTTSAPPPSDTMKINDTIWLQVGDKITVMPDNFELGFDSVIEDGRCPTEYICMYAGKAVLRLWLKKSGSNKKFIYPELWTPGFEEPIWGPVPVDTLDCRFTLLELHPYPVNLDPISQEDYIARLKVSSLINSVIITDLPRDSIELDRFDLCGLDVIGDSVEICIDYSGGCKVHSFQLYMSPSGFTLSNPGQADLYLRHDANGDACRRLINRQIRFDLRPVARLYQDIYDRLDPIQVNVHYYQDSLGRKISDTYYPGDIGK
jgi:hypothetical protein